jgi:flagellar hook assembly protein FlgD
VTATPDAPPAANSALAANYPNPFNPSTTIAFRVGQAGPVRLVVHDAAGRVVRTLVDESLSTAAYTIEWNGRDDTGRGVGSGVYFYRLDTVDFSETRRMVLLK